MISSAAVVSPSHTPRSYVLVAVRSRSLVSARRREQTSEARHTIRDSYDVLIGSLRFNEHTVHLSWVRNILYSEQVRYFALWREYHSLESAAALGATYGVYPEADGAEEDRQGMLAWRTHCERVLDGGVGKHRCSHDPPHRYGELLKPHGSALQSAYRRLATERDCRARGRAVEAGVVLVDQVREPVLFGAEVVGFAERLAFERAARARSEPCIDADRVRARCELRYGRRDTTREQRNRRENSDFHFDPLISIRTVSEGESNARGPLRKALS